MGNTNYWKPYYRDPALDFILDGYAWIHDLFDRCHSCHWRRAAWSYMPGRDNLCEECVPRGCSCGDYPIDDNHDNMDPANWTSPTDEQGRKWPCCEWWSIDNPPRLVWSSDPEEMARIKKSLDTEGQVG